MMKKVLFLLAVIPFCLISADKDRVEKRRDITKNYLEKLADELNYQSQKIEELQKQIDDLAACIAFDESRVRETMNELEIRLIELEKKIDDLTKLSQCHEPFRNGYMMKDGN